MPEQPDAVVGARESIRHIARDPVTKLLLENSQLTLPQLETLLADSLAREHEGQKTQRRLYRPTRTRVSRGSYNRSLIQAQNNVIQSIYTILLLGYVGLFDSAALQPFVELSDTIQGYIQERRKGVIEDRATIEQLNRRLIEAISALAKRDSFKDIL